MISRKKSRRLDISIKTTISKILLVMIPHLFIIGMILFFLRHENFTIYLLLISMILVLASLIYFVRLHLTLQSKKSIKSLYIDAENNWMISRKEGGETRVTVSSTSFVSNLILILNLKHSTQNNSSVLVCADSVNKEEFRVLKVILKTKKLDNSLF